MLEHALRFDLGETKLIQRDDRIDALRGFALLAIFADHVPWNPLSLLTPRAFALSDAAELFFFLSGFSAALVYTRHMRERGFLSATVRIWRRTWVIYSAQLVLFVFLAAEVAGLVAFTGNSAYFAAFRLDTFMAQTEISALPILLMSYQPGYLDILPVYVVFFLALPWILHAATKNIWLVLVPSLLLYAATQEWGWTFKTFPWNAGWYFNPLAWQFLFVLGVAFGQSQYAVSRALPNWLCLGAGAFAAIVAVFQLSTALHDFIPAVPALHIHALLRDEKEYLGWPRLMSFFALLTIAAKYLPQKGRLEQMSWARPFISCGRHSLPVFCFGALLAAVGVVAWDFGGHSVPVQCAVGIAGTAALIAFAGLLDWLKQLDRQTSPVVGVLEALPTQA